MFLIKPLTSWPTTARITRDVFGCYLLFVNLRLYVLIKQIGFASSAKSNQHIICPFLKLHGSVINLHVGIANLLFDNDPFQ